MSTPNAKRFEMAVTYRPTARECKSKGLTSPSVYIVGAVQGVLPTAVSESESERAAAVNEGRRLFYVAITRAAEDLVISGVAKIDLADANSRRVTYEQSTLRRGTDGRFTVRTIPSQYLREFGRSAHVLRPGKTGFALDRSTDERDTHEHASRFIRSLHWKS
jgi:superfamily I DNA/RNA helicase